MSTGVHFSPVVTKDKMRLNSEEEKIIADAFLSFSACGSAVSYQTFSAQSDMYQSEYTDTD